MLYDKYEHQARAYSSAIMQYQALLVDLSGGPALKFCGAKNTLYKIGKSRDKNYNQQYLVPP